jgi:DNA modification methylase
MSNGYITYTVSNPLELTIPRNTVDLIITQVPALGSSKIMGVDSANTINTQDQAKYLKDLRKLTKGLYSVLKPGGSLFITTGPFIDMAKRYVIDVLDQKQFFYSGDIIEFNNAFNHEEYSESIQYNKIRTWHHFSKGMPYVNPFELRKHTMPVWANDYSHEGYDTVNWLAETYPSISTEIMPDIADNMISSFSKPGSLVLDIFGGAGTVAVTAASLGRNAISSDPDSSVIKPAKLNALVRLGERFLENNVKVVME